MENTPLTYVQQISEFYEKNWVNDEFKEKLKEKDVQYIRYTDQ